MRRNSSMGWTTYYWARCGGLTQQAGGLRRGGLAPRMRESSGSRGATHQLISEEKAGAGHAKQHSSLRNLLPAWFVNPLARLHRDSVAARLRRYGEHPTYHLAFYTNRSAPRIGATWPRLQVRRTVSELLIGVLVWFPRRAPVRWLVRRLPRPGHQGGAAAGCGGTRGSSVPWTSPWSTRTSPRTSRWGFALRAVRVSHIRCAIWFITYSVLITMDC
jgi:hypothetical protein